MFFAIAITAVVIIVLFAAICCHRRAPRPKRPIAVITGSGSGIGFETALELARRGWTVFALVYDKAQLRLFKEMYKSAIVALVADVTSDSSVSSAVDQVKAELQRRGRDERVDAIVNNAGVVAAGPLETLDLDQMLVCFRVHCLGSLRVARAFLHLLRVRDKTSARTPQWPARIVHVSSGAAVTPAPLYGGYGAAKAAQAAVADTLRVELSQCAHLGSDRQVTVTCVQLPMVNTAQAHNFENLLGPGVPRYRRVRQLAMGLHKHLLNTSITAADAARSLSDACEAREVAHRWRVGSMKSAHLMGLVCPFDAKARMISMLSTHYGGTTLQRSSAL